MSFNGKNSILAKTADEPLWLLTGELSSRTSDKIMRILF